MSDRSRLSLVATIDPKRADSWRTILSDAGYEVCVVENAKEAKDLVSARGAPDLLIADVSLPRVDGFTIIQQLRRVAAPPRMNVIVISEHETGRLLANQLSNSLAIAQVVAADTDITQLRAIVDAASRAERRSQTGSGPSPNDINITEALDGAALKLASRFPGALSLAYIRVEGREFIAAHLSPSSDGAEVTWGDIALLRDIATSEAPRIVPEVIDGMLEERWPLLRRAPADRLVAVPLKFSHEHATGAVCVLTIGRSPIGLDVDTLRSFANDLVRLFDGPNNPLLGSRRSVDAAINGLSQDVDWLQGDDPLTGLYTRRGAERRIASELSRARRHQTPLSCMVLALDGFENLRLAAGPYLSDRLLRDTSHVLRTNVRAYDLPVRWNNTQFVVVLPGVDREGCRTPVDRVYGAMKSVQLPGLPPISIRTGTATLGPDQDFDGMYAQATRELAQLNSAYRGSA